MILWISGPYGVGKSTLAEVLAGQLPGAMIFDAEAVGNAVRGNYPGEPMGVILRIILCGGCFAGSCWRICMGAGKPFWCL